MIYQSQASCSNYTMTCVFHSIPRWMPAARPYSKTSKLSYCLLRGDKHRRYTRSYDNVIYFYFQNMILPIYF